MSIFPIAISTNESRMCCPAHKAPRMQIVNKSDSSQARKLVLHSERCVVPDTFPQELLGVSQHLSEEFSPAWRLPVAFTTHSGSSRAVRESPVLYHPFCSHKSSFNGSSFPSGRFQTAPKSQAQYQQFSCASSLKAVSPSLNPHLKTTVRWALSLQELTAFQELSIAADTSEPTPHSHLTTSILANPSSCERSSSSHPAAPAPCPARAAWPQLMPWSGCLEQRLEEIKRIKWAFIKGLH